jgi:segregation and condensation protein A
MLIPRKPMDEEGNEIDPREELVARLLEYKRYKSVLAELREMEAARGRRNYRGNITAELAQIATRALVDVELESVTLFKLLKAYERMLTRIDEEGNRPAIHEITQFSHTVEEQQVRMASSSVNHAPVLPIYSASVKRGFTPSLLSWAYWSCSMHAPSG